MHGLTWGWVPASLTLQRIWPHISAKSFPTLLLVTGLVRWFTRPCSPLQVKYSSLPNFEEREEDFRAESVLLRRRFTEDGACGHEWFSKFQP